MTGCNSSSEARSISDQPLASSARSKGPRMAMPKRDGAFEIRPGGPRAEANSPDAEGELFELPLLTVWHQPQENRMNYIDGFVATVATANKQGYLDYARKVAQVFEEHGALQ